MERTYLKETHLSRKPSRDNAIMGFLGVGFLTLFSLIYWTNLFGLAPWLTASAQTVFGEGQYWRLFTSIAIHADIQHLLSNCLGFFLFGFLLYDYFGFFVFPVSTVFLGALTSGLALRSYDPEVELIGASGMVYLMVGTWLMLYLFIERRLTMSLRLVRLVGFTLAVLMPTSFEKAVSYRTHAIGFSIGVVFGLFYFIIQREKLRRAEKWATEVIDDEEILAIS